MGRRGGGGWGGGGRGTRRKSLNSKYDNLMQSSCARPLELLAPSRGKNVVDRGREASRQALLERFGVKDSMAMVHSSSIDLPHLPRLQALDKVSHRKPRNREEPEEPEPEQWLVDIMYPGRAEHASQPPSLAVSPFEPLNQQENVPDIQVPQAQAHGLAPTHPNALPQPSAALPSAHPQAQFAPLPQIPMQGPPWMTPMSMPTPTASSMTSPFVPLWLTPHGVVDITGRPLHLPSPFVANSPPRRRRKRYSSTSQYSLPAKRRRRKYGSYSPDSDCDDYDSELDDVDYEDLRRDRRTSHYKRSSRQRSPEDERGGYESRRRGRRWDNGGRDLDEFLEEEGRVGASEGDDFSRTRGWDAEEEVDHTAPDPAQVDFPGEQDSNGRARSANVRTFVRAHESRDQEERHVDLPSSPPSPRQRAEPRTRHSHQDNDPAFLPTPPQTSSTTTTNGHQEGRRDLRGRRLVKSLETAAESMADVVVDMRSVDYAPSPDPVEPVEYPPTPATTRTTLSQPSHSNPSPQTTAQSGSDHAGKSPARMQRATERAWATLAALQPRHEQHDPVGEGTPAPPSPALAPVDSESPAEELVDDFEESESIYQFSDDGRYAAEVPQFALEAEEAEDIEAVGPSPPPVPGPKSSFGEGSKVALKRVRFASDTRFGSDIGAVGDSDPGFTIWRDGY